jgi:predicted permease
MGWMSRLRNSFWRRESQYDLLVEEQELHLELRTRDNVARGMLPAAARADALRRFGNTALLRDRTLDADRLAWADGLARDLRLALRSLTRRKGLAVTAIASLALGIGANSAVFSVIDAVLLRPLPLPHPERLVVIEESKHGEASNSNPARLADWASQVTLLAAAAGFYGEGLVLTGQGEAERLRAVRTFGRPLAVLGIRPLLGRGFTAAEEAGHGDRVALVAERLWRRRFGADPRLLGRSLTLSGQPYQVIGVVPDGLGYPADFDLLAPAPLDVQRTSRHAGFLKVVARMKPAATLPGLRAELATVARRLAAEYPDTDGGRGARPVPLAEDQNGGSRLPLLLLLGTVALVLLIACVNIASLLLARAAERQREAAIRAALGAGRGGLVRLYLVESLLLALAGGGLGLLLAGGLLVALKRLLPAETPRLATAHLDPRVAGFGLLLSLLCGLAFGLAPAWKASRGRPAGARAGASAGDLRTRRLLVALLVLLWVVLLAGAGLLAKSLSAMRGAPLGFRPDGVLAVKIDLPWDTPKPRLDSFDAQALAAFAALPGVDRVGLVDRLPLEGGSQSGPIAVDGRLLSPSLAVREVSHRAASDGYFRALGIPLRSGRFLHDAGPASSGPREALVNEALAKAFFPDGDALGRRITFDVKPEPGKPPVWFEIAGVVGDVRQSAGESVPVPEVFVLPRDTYWPLARFVLHVSGVAGAAVAPGRLAPAVRRAVRRIAPDLPVDEIATLDSQVDLATADSRVRVRLLGGFAIVALWLAALGLYGLLASDVAQRRHEIGVRLALGALPERVARAVLGKGMAVVAAGLALGLGGAVVLGRWLGALLFGVRPVDLPVLVGVSLTMLAVAAVASYLPASRAAEVDPVIALRHE